MREFIDICNDKNINLYLLSNAPYRWCERISNSLDLHRYIDHNNILASDTEIFGNNIKPENELYNKIYKYVQINEKTKDVYSYFIDDNYRNLQPLIYDYKWRPILFKGSFRNISKQIK
jgi:FMN phosphatase YigB (HAD superfamily)